MKTRWQLFPFELVAAALVLFATLTPLTAQTIVANAGSKLEWNQVAPTLSAAQTYVYRYYRDAQASTPVATPSTGARLVGVLCAQRTSTTSSPLGTFPCAAPFPPDTPGVTHTIAITAASADGVSESDKTAPWSYVFTLVPSIPQGLSGK